MYEKKDDVLGRYDELELIELSEADTYGGGSPAIISAATAVAGVGVAVSVPFCPTSKCSSQC
jgi:hypothetical protein